MTVYKYQLHPGIAQFYMPAGARPLSVREQNGEIMLWAMVDTFAPCTEMRTFLATQTGEFIQYDPSKLNFIGTVEMDGWWIGHVFEVTP